ncbi:MAG: M20 family metallo-hydrolase [Chloroflexi bacterium]|nr:M20 family metallo-hydrolase [Chloroflexota bacterium]
MTDYSTLRIDPDRFLARFEALAKIGATPGGGVHRPAFSDAHLSARRWFLEQAEQIGLETQVDGAGNHSAILRCGPPDGRTLLLGSHLDSVPYGGRFDGPLGVLAALEVIQMVQEQGIRLNTHLEVIDFTDEEGYLMGLMGSQALAGLLQEEHLQHPDCDRDEFERILGYVGLSDGTILSAARDSTEIAGYLELHIEQGTRLIEMGAQIGVVTGIVGIRCFRVKFIGRADHSGTTPMDRRLDAAQGACAFSLAAREIVMADFSGCVTNVGNMKFEPGASNIVPEVVTVALEFRSGDEAMLDAMQAALLERALAKAQRFGLELETEAFENVVPAHTDERFRQTLSGACQTLGLEHALMSSGAGHDAQSLAHICPIGMVFVPSVSGFSHSSREFTQWEDCVNGANVLLQTVLTIL